MASARHQGTSPQVNRWGLGLEFCLESLLETSRKIARGCLNWGYFLICVFPFLTKTLLSWKCFSVFFFLMVWLGCNSWHKIHPFKRYNSGVSLAVQWLKCELLLQGALVQSLVRELRSHMPQSAAKKYINKIKPSEPMYF